MNQKQSAMKRYELLKDIPDAKAGAILLEDGDVYSYNNGDAFYNKKYVENNPEFFKEIVQRDWEIVKGVNKALGVHDWREDCEAAVRLGNCKIHSVKRLSDNETFVVGEEITDIGNIQKYTITEFIIHNNWLGGVIVKTSTSSIAIGTARKISPLPTTNKEEQKIVFKADEKRNRTM